MSILNRPGSQSYTNLTLLLRWHRRLSNSFKTNEFWSRIGNIAHFKIFKRNYSCSRKVKPLQPHSHPQKPLKCLLKQGEHEKPELKVKVIPPKNCEKRTSIWIMKVDSMQQNKF